MTNDAGATDVDVAGQPCLRLSNDHLVVDLATAVGPRLLGLSLVGGPNLFAELPEAELSTDAGPVRLYGGHRLWRAPEVPALSWSAEDEPVKVRRETSAAVTVGASVRGPARDGIARELRVTLDHGRAAATIEHELTNEGSSAVLLAPWAISMFRLGGTAVLPLERAPGDEDGLQASGTRVVLWPYTDVSDPCLTWRRDAIVIDTSATRPGTSSTNKVGIAGAGTWCAYVLDGVVVVKRAVPAESPVDHGATQQVFWEQRFVEVETLGPLVELAPGGSITHVERWELERVPADEDPLLHALFVGERGETLDDLPI